MAAADGFEFAARRVSRAGVAKSPRERRRQSRQWRVARRPPPLGSRPGPGPGPEPEPARRREGPGVGVRAAAGQREVLQDAVRQHEERLLRVILGGRRDAPARVGETPRRHHRDEIAPRAHEVRVRRVFLHRRVERARLAHRRLHSLLMRVARRTDAVAAVEVNAAAHRAAAAAQHAFGFLEESRAERAEGDDGVAAGRDLEAPARLRGSSIGQQAIDAEFDAKPGGVLCRVRRRRRRRREGRRGRRGKRREQFERGESRLFHRGRRAERPERRRATRAGAGQPLGVVAE